MNLAVDNPILNNPFNELTRYWLYEQARTRVRFSRLLEEAKTRVEVIVTFLAVLELIKGSKD